LKEGKRMNIYVGNLPRDVTEDELRKAFEAFGAVESVALIKDRDTGEMRGFAFIEMTVDTEAEAAIAAWNGKAMRGRNLTVNQARPKPDRRGPRRDGGERKAFGDRRSFGSDNRRNQR